MARILIADDDRQVLCLVQRLLNDAGYETREASNGLSALQFFHTFFFDLIITDLRMPGMDGMGFINEVRQLEPAVPIIVLTAYAVPEVTECDNNKGKFIYMAKPFEIDALLGCITEVLSCASRSYACS